MGERFGRKRRGVDWHPENNVDGYVDIPADLQISFGEDPLSRLEANHRSSTNALVYCIATTLVTLVAGFALVIVSRELGGPLCDAGVSRVACSRGFEIAIPVIPSVIVFLCDLGVLWNTYAAWKSYRRWRPWLAAMWYCFLFSMLWMTTTWPMAITGHPR